MSNNKLPSRFQIGDTVSIRRSSGVVSIPSVRIIGVQFTESKVFYLILTDEDRGLYTVVDSDLVDEVKE